MDNSVERRPYRSFHKTDDYNESVAKMDAALAMGWTVFLVLHVLILADWIRGASGASCSVEPVWPYQATALIVLTIGVLYGSRSGSLQRAARVSPPASSPVRPAQHRLLVWRGIAVGVVVASLGFLASSVEFMKAPAAACYVHSMIAPLATLTGVAVMLASAWAARNAD